MSDLDSMISRVRAHAQVDWRPERAERALAGTLRLERRRRVVRGSVAGAAVLALAIVLGLRVHHAPGDASLVRFADGSTAYRLAPATRLLETTRNHVVLEQGSARFSVVHDPSRRFVVDAGGVTIEVLGTQFTVSREPDAVRVAVEHGRVHVQDDAGERLLTDGEQARFGRAPRAEPPKAEPAPAQPAAVGPTPAEPAQAEPAPVEATPAPIVKRARHDHSWQALARDGEFDHAYEAMAREAPPRDDAVELLLAADVARLSHHPHKAVAPLEAVLARHPRDPRAPLAAFTLGRVLLDELGRPREAAAAFARAGELDGTGLLAEDALAREVEALSRAGETTRARDRALAYVTRYPHGGRLRLVRRYGGLE